MKKQVEVKLYKNDIISYIKCNLKGLQQIAKDLKILYDHDPTLLESYQGEFLLYTIVRSTTRTSTIKQAITYYSNILKYTMLLTHDLYKEGDNNG